jgi:hypothetical protein
MPNNALTALDLVCAPRPWGYFGTPGAVISGGTNPGAPTMLWYAASSSNAQGQDGGNNYKCRPPVATKAGNCLVLRIMYPHYDPGGGLWNPTVSDNVNGTWPAAAITVDAGLNNQITKVYVFPNSAAGLVTVNVAFSDPPQWYGFNYDLSEWSNIAAVNPVDGTKSAVSQTGTALSCGSFTPSTNNDANGGHLILAFFDEGVMNGDAPLTSWVPGGSFSLLMADVGWATSGGSSAGYPRAAMSFVQTANGAINPSITANGNSGHINCAAIALKASPTQGMGRDTGIYVNKILHYSTYLSPPTTWNVQIPATGNLWVIQANAGSEFTSITDNVGDSVSWSSVVSGNWSGIWYRSAPANGKNNLMVTISEPANSTAESFRFFDISGAAASNVLDVSAIHGSYLAPGPTTITDTPVITPSAAGVGGICIIASSLGTGPGLGFGTGAPANASWDLPNFDGQTDVCTMTNSDCCGHVLVTSTATIHGNWNTASVPNNLADGVAAVFKKA